MIRPLTIVFVIIFSFISASAVRAQYNIRPAELQQMMSIIKYIEDRIKQDSTNLPPKVRMNTILESLEILGIDTGDRTRFKPGLTSSKISVLLLGGQLPGRRRVGIENAIAVLNLSQIIKDETKDAATRQPIQVGQKPVNMSKIQHPATFKTGQKAQPRTIMAPGKAKLYFDLDEIVFKAVSKASRE